MRLQALFADAARGADRYTRLDEREIAADLVPWLMERPNSRLCGAGGTGGVFGSRPAPSYSHVRGATARRADGAGRSGGQQPAPLANPTSPFASRLGFSIDRLTM